MSGLDSLHGLTGQWTGSNAVILHEDAPHESSTTAEISRIVGGKFVQVAYSWAFDGTPQEGLLILGQEAGSDAVTTVWIDSWHMGDKFLICQGQAEASGVINVLGSYKIEGYPDWGWRIIIDTADQTFSWKMYNISPEGEEYLGVETSYTKVE